VVYKFRCFDFKSPDQTSCCFASSKNLISFPGSTLKKLINFYLIKGLSLQQSGTGKITGISTITAG